MLRDFLTPGAVARPGLGNDDPNGPTAFNEGQLGPLGVEIGPLPASTMPGKWAEAIPTMANFNYLLKRLNRFTLTVLDEGVALVDANGRSAVIGRLNFRGSAVQATLDAGDATQANIDVTGGGGGGAIFYGPDPPPVPTDWIAWWNTEEGALKVYYTDVDSVQWVDSAPARTGEPGTAGSVWRNGNGPPSNGLGVDGDYYLDDLTGDIYFKAAGVYTVIFSITTSGNTIITKDEGVLVDANASTLNFVGGGVAATDAGAGVTTVTIPGGNTIITKDNGSTVDTAATTLNFVGPGVSATNAGGGETTVTIPGGGGPTGADPASCNGRLTLQSGVPVPSTDQTAKTTVYWTPYKGSQIALFDGTFWTSMAFAETSLALGTLAAAFQAYDVYGYDNAGVLGLERLEWSSATVTMTIASPGVVTWTGHTLVNGNSICLTTSGALPTGLTANSQYYVVSAGANTFQLATVPNGTAINTSGSQSGVHTAHGAHARATALVVQDGVLVKSGDTTRRYLGTFFATSTTTTEDSGGGATTSVGGKRFLYNYYGRVERHMAVIETTDSWSYTTNAYRQARATLGNRVEYIAGVNEGMVRGALLALSISATGGSRLSVNLDATTSAGRYVATTGASTTVYGNSNVPYIDPVGLGYHGLYWLEYGVTSANFYGDVGTDQTKTGMTASLFC